MKHCFLLLALASATFAAPTDDFIAAARKNHGEFGAKAATFLVENMPQKDKETLTEEFLTENLNLAFKAREEFPWAKTVPEEIFLNDVLPYAVFNEPRDPWRADFYEKSAKIVKEANAKTLTQAAMAINKKFFNVVNVHYNTGRRRANQSPKESIEISKATCTGLSIILVDACRAVGIPARGAGTPMWANNRGNHTWAEIWDGDWQFTGADEQDPNGMNRGWFAGDAAQAKADQPRYAIYATTWKREGLFFPMRGGGPGSEIAGLNITRRYTKDKAPEEGSFLSVGIRLWDKKGEGRTRLVSKMCIYDGNRRECGVAETKAGTADLNDMPRFTLKPGSEGSFRFTINGEAREVAYGPLQKDNATIDAYWADLTPAKESIAK